MGRTIVKLLIAVTVVLLAGGFWSRPDRATGWSSALGADTHEVLTNMVIRWFREDGWQYRGTRIGFFQFGDVGDYAGTEPDTRGPCPLCKANGAYHRVSDHMKEMCRVYGSEVDGCPYREDWDGAEKRAVYWANRARDALRDGDFGEAQKFAGYAIHYVQDAVNPPHVDPWRQGEGLELCGAEAPHTSFEVCVGTNHHLYLRIDKHSTHILTFPEAVDKGGGRKTFQNDENLMEAVRFLAKQTDKDWPGPPNEDYSDNEDVPGCGDDVTICAKEGTANSEWDTWDPRRMPESDPRRRVCSENDDESWLCYSDEIRKALERAALLTEAVLIYVFDFTPPELDLAFVIDTTGSMSDDIAAAKSAATHIVNRVMDAVPDSRIALVDFRDFPVSPYGGAGDYDYHDALAFTSDRTAAINAINGLTLGWGGDWPEDHYCALMHAINGHTCRGSGVGSGIGDWRNIPSKFIILMTDAPPHDPEPFTGFTWSDVATAARNADPITIEVVGIGGADPALEQIAAETGGRVFTAPTASDVVAAIMEAIETILESPVADAGGPYEGTVGSPITFDASGSFDPDGTIVSYEWDWEDDGVYDETTASPVIDHTYSAAFAGQVRLRVTDNDGLTSVDTATVTVTGNQPPSLTVPSEQSVQYSDPLSFSVSATDPNDPPGSLSFSATGLPVGLALSDNLDGTARVSGTVLAAAGNYPAEITVTDPGGLTDSGTVPVVVSKEDAVLAYTGDALVTAGSPVTLRADVTEVADGSPGDITKAAVFFDVTARIGGGTTTYGPVPVSPSGEASLSFPSGLPTNLYSVDVRMDPANGYYRADPADTAALVVYDPSAGFTTGGGWIWDGGSKGNFGFSVKYVGKGANIRGQALYVYRDSGAVTRVKSNAMQWLVISGNTALFHGKATVNDVGNHTFEITVVDNGEPGSADTFAIKIWRPDGTLLHELPATTLGGGNLIVPQPKRR